MLGFIIGITIYALLSSERFWDLLHALLQLPVPPRDTPTQAEDGDTPVAPTPTPTATSDPAAPYTTRITPASDEDAQVIEWDVINHKPQKP